MVTTKEQTSATTLPELAVPDVARAISIVNRWLYQEVKTLVHASRAVFIPSSYCWHLPVQISYPDVGLLGVK